MSRDTNFYYSFLALPAEKRRAIIAVWDFCRAVDDAVDEPAVSGSSGTPDAVAAAVERWRSEVAACFDGRAPHTAEGERLQPFIDRFGLPREAFEQLVIRLREKFKSDVVVYEKKLTRALPDSLLQKARGV